MAIEAKSQQGRQDAQTPAPNAGGNRISDSDDEMIVPHKQIRLQRYYIDVDDAVFE